MLRRSGALHPCLCVTGAAGEFSPLSNSNLRTAACSAQSAFNFLLDCASLSRGFRRSPHPTDSRDCRPWATARRDTGCILRAASTASCSRIQMAQSMRPTPPHAGYWAAQSKRSSPRGRSGISVTSGPSLLGAMRESARTGTFRGRSVILRADGIEVPAESPAWLPMRAVRPGPRS